MNRTLWYKLAYVGATVGLGVVTLVIWRGFGYSSEALVVIVLLLLIPGRLQGYLWRDLYRGRRLISTGQWQKGEEHLERFLTQIRNRPWLKRLMGLSWSFHTWNVEALTRNNLGAIRLELADLAAAEKELRAACELDPKYPVPYFNLAILARMRGNIEESEKLLSRARALGYTGGTSDQLAQLAAEALARVEGRGTTS